MSDRFTCLVVDDEPLAREAVRNCIASDPELEMIGEAMDGAEAIASIKQLRPDLLFLDVQMPELDGFEVLQALQASGEAVPGVIFVTAFDQYAIRAFEAEAFDYLVKPVDPRRFSKALRSAKARIRGERQQADADKLLKLLSSGRRAQRFAVKSQGKIVFVRVDDIQWIEARGNYLRLHTGDGVHLLRETMASIENRLDPERFMRIHRSTIVNVDGIKDIEPWYTGEYIVRMRSGKELTLSRSYRENLKRYFKMGKEELTK